MTNERQPHGMLMSIREVQTALSCGKTKAWELVKSGYLTPIKLGSKTTRFQTEQVLKLVNTGI